MQNLVAIISFAFLLISNISFGQISFYKNYSDNGYDFAEGVVQLEDSSYVICGSSSSFTNGPSQAFLLKVDSVGNYKWSNHYGGFESESARRVLYKKDFGYFIAGHTNSYGNGAYDYYLAKIDENAQLEWHKSFGFEGWEKVHDAALTRDTGVIMVGMTNSTGNSNKDWYIVRTDINGDTLWTKTIGGPGNEFGRTIERYNDSMYVLGGSLFAMDSMKTRGLIIYMGDNGVIYDRDTLGVTGAYDIYDFTISNDTLHGIGTYQFNADSQTQMALYSLRLLTTSISPFGYFDVALEGDYIGKHITTYGDVSSRYVAYTYENMPLAFPFGVDTKVSRYGWDLSWLNTVAVVAADYTDEPNQFIPTSDGGAMLVGYREGIGIGGSTIFALKIGPDETVPVIENVTFIDQLVEIEESTIVETEFRFYPNPTDYKFTVEVPMGEHYDLRILDMSGKTILEETVFMKQEINVSAISPGVYNMELGKHGDRLLTRRIIIH